MKVWHHSLLIVPRSLPINKDAGVGKLSKELTKKPKLIYTHTAVSTKCCKVSLLSSHLWNISSEAIQREFLKKREKKSSFGWLMLRCHEVKTCIRNSRNKWRLMTCICQAGPQLLPSARINHQENSTPSFSPSLTIRVIRMNLTHTHPAEEYLSR